LFEVLLLNHLKSQFNTFVRNMMHRTDFKVENCKIKLFSQISESYVNCFNAISKAVALIFVLLGFKACAFSIAFLMISEVS